MTKLPRLIRHHCRSFFPVMGAPCCEKMSEWLSLNAFSQLKHLSLASNADHTELLIIVGHISHKQAPVLQHFYSRMLYPNSVLYLKGCNTHLVGYTCMKNLSTLIPIHFTIDACPFDLQAIEKVLS